MILAQDDLETVTVCSVRYALGRRSYVVGDVAGIVRAVWSELRPSIRNVIIKDVDEALRGAEARGTTVGMQMDHDVWMLLRGWMDAQIKQESE